MKIKCLFVGLIILLAYETVHSQVNLQTGSAVFSIPMFNWQDDKSNLNSIVSLNYNSSNGVKVNEVASNVGQGWNLSAGGRISRMQVGEPDDQIAFNGVNGSDQDITRYPAGILYSSVKAFKGCPMALTKYPIYGAMNVIYSQHNKTAEDRQMDYFAFQFNGKSGLFVIDLSNGGTGWSLGDSKMKISFQTDPSMANNTSNGIRTSISSFTIQDEDGLIYKFGLQASERGLTKVLENHFCDASATNPLQQPEFKNGQVYHEAGFENSSYVNPWIINDWFLSEVSDPLTGRKITFTYNNLSLSNDAGFDITDNQSDKDYIIVTHKKSIAKSPELTGITYPDGHSVSINYATNSRFDFPGEKAISSIDIKYLDKSVISSGDLHTLSEYQLNTQYFMKSVCGYPTSEDEKRSARLCLKSVKKIGIDLKDDTPPYLFDYYTTSSGAVDDFIPPPFFYAKDIYGYFNGNNNVPDNNSGSIPLNVSITDLSFHALKGLCFLNANTGSGATMIVPNPKSKYSANGLLRQIIYPTGGILQYEYDQNITGTSTLYGGVHVSKTKMFDGGYSNDCNHPIETQYNYVTNGSGSNSSLWGTESPVNKVSMASHYGPELRKFHFAWSCGVCCFWKYKYPGILSQYQAIGLSTIQSVMNILAPVLTIVGVLSDIMDVVNLFTAPTGVLTVIAVIVDVVCIILGLVLTCTGDGGASDYSSNIFYNTDLNAVAPMPVQFKRVEVVGGPGDAGKTIQTFTSSSDYPIWYNTNSQLSAKQRFAPWAYGLPLVTSVYNAAGSLVKYTSNTYDMTNAQRLLGTCNNDPQNQTSIASSLISCKCQVQKTTSERNTDWSKVSSIPGDGGYDDPNSYIIQSVSAPNPMNVDIYGMYTGRVELKSTLERVYSTVNSTQYEETLTQYSYNNSNNFAVNEISTQHSNGDITYQDLKYSNDYSGGAFDIMNQNNLIAVPVESTTSILKMGSTVGKQFLNEKVTEYGQLANGALKPVKTLEQRFSQPVTSLSAYQGYNNLANPVYKQVQSLTYSSTGNLIGVQDEGGHSISNLYDYDDKLIVGTIVNANPLVDKIAYTSFETTTFGGWALAGGAAVYNNSLFITGKRSFVINSRTLSASGLNTAKIYRLSFWASGSISVAGASSVLVATVAGLNGFTYYEYNLAQGASNISLSGTGNLDELRLYPQNARMSTTTFEPITGKTSECDENNRVTYYSYDNLGRLQFVKDDRSNVVKMYEYNTVSRQTGCPSSFSNRLLSETFTRNNCGSNQGTNVTYTVAANTFTSVISQEDADSKALTKLLSEGQALANTNGACLVVYHNNPISQSYVSQNCGDGFIGSPVTYTVPGNRYSSVVNQADADAQAMAELNANGQANANQQANQVCLIDYTPQWEGTDASATSCQTSGGVNTGHKLMLLSDNNPNSSTYNTSAWMDVGVDLSTCPISSGFSNLLINGNFENGAGSFATDYKYVVSSPETVGNYMVGSNPYTYNTGFCSMSNHTSGGSKMLIVDGSTTPSDRFWYSMVNVTANKTYKFTYWCSRISNYSNPVIRLVINGTAVSDYTITSSCGWQQVQVTWNSGSNTSAFIQMNSQSSATIGNDFAIDDMSFIQQ